jgi:pyruvate kinase
MNNLAPNLDKTTLRPLLQQLLSLHKHVCEQAEARVENYKKVHSTACPDGALNLARYLALRSFDLRSLQDALSRHGFSSLGRGEASVSDNLNQVINLLCCLLGETPPDAITKQALSAEAGRVQLKQNTSALLGAPPANRDVHIMVTLPTAASHDYPLVKSLMSAGMSCARINCAHDNKDAWLGMIKNVRRAEQESTLSCRVMMDLAGQKIRTGRIEAGPKVHHIKVKRDELGKTLSAGKILILSESQFSPSVPEEVFKIAFKDDIHAQLQINDRLDFIDNRGKHRQLKIESRDNNGYLLARCWYGAYITEQTRFQPVQKDKTKSTNNPRVITISGFQTQAAKIRVKKGDQLLLTDADIPGKPAQLDETGKTLLPASIGITLGDTGCSLLSHLKPGAEIWIDDGKIGTEVKTRTERGLEVVVKHVRTQGALIKSDKGVNFPDTELDLPALTNKDLEDLDFICQHADIVGYSFVQSRQDMENLHRELDKRHANALPIVAKIETRKAVKNLHEIIFSTLGRQPLGVMIARGDLAVELGSVRMAEIQEEILWLCEAAHVPVVWATQVLESLAKEGIQSRPEITDAAMSVRAECVMLNKGPYILEAVTVLDDILVRMQAHFHKKSPRMRALRQWL